MSDECQSCKGVGYFERYYNEFDLMDIECGGCDGTGEADNDD